MKHILEFNTYSDNQSGYKVSNWENDIIEGQFEVSLEANDGESHEIYIKYQSFLKFIKQEMPNLKSYLDNEDFKDVGEMQDGLEETGINFKDILQKYINESREY